MGLRHDYVKVLDFGLVKSVSTDSDETVGTMAGFTPGTPAYMAPEQAMGEKVDHRVDIYALGCVVYFMLTGLKVFEADTPLQMINRHDRAHETCVAQLAAARTEADFITGLAILECEAEKWCVGRHRSAGAQAAEPAFHA